MTRWGGPNRNPATPQALYEFIGFDDPAIAAKVRDLIGEHGQSLYVGRSNNLGARTSEHAANQEKQVWWRQTHVMVFHHLPPGTTAGQAGRSERRLIASRRPWFNKKDNYAGYRHEKYLEAARRYEQEFNVRPRLGFGLTDLVAGYVSRAVRFLVPAVAGALFTALVFWAQAIL